MLKILISAFACAPNSGGEGQISWDLVTSLAVHHEIWVITQAHYESEIRAFTQKQPIRNLHFVFYDIPGLKSLVSRFYSSYLLRPYLSNIYYYLWQLAIYPVVKALHNREHFDLTQHISYTRYWMPSLLALLPTPFIWGTVGGADVTPPSLKNTFSMRGQFFETVRESMLHLAEFDPLVHLTARRSALALAITPATKARLRGLGVRTIVQAFDSGIEVDDKIPPAGDWPTEDNAPLRLLSVGRLIHWKGQHLSLQAFAQCFDLPMEYWLFGEGAERRRLEDLCRALNIQDRVRFFGFVPREQVLQARYRSQIFVHASLHETGGWSVLEAMAAGLPVICLDLGGPSVSVSDLTGIKVPTHSPQQVIDDLAIAMRTLALDPSLRKQMGTAGRERVREHFSLETKTNQMLNLYADICYPQDRL